MEKNSFDSDRDGTGTMEWAEVTENICIGCPNNCRYCYAAERADRLGYHNRENWVKERFSKRASMKSYPAKGGVIMFPSSHDITPFNVDEFIRVATLILEKENKLLIVSKPRFEIIKKVCGRLTQYQENILFRFTIGTLTDQCSEFWEPGAPLPQERIASLKFAFNAGFNTSVSIEPMLGGPGMAVDVALAVNEFTTDTIWIGKMNKIRSRLDMTKEENIGAANHIESEQSDENIIKLYNYCKDHPKIRWKDSIKEVLRKMQVREFPV